MKLIKYAFLFAVISGVAMADDNVPAPSHDAVITTQHPGSMLELKSEFDDMDSYQEIEQKAEEKIEEKAVKDATPAKAEAPAAAPATTTTEK